MAKKMVRNGYVSMPWEQKYYLETTKGVLFACISSFGDDFGILYKDDMAYLLYDLDEDILLSSDEVLGYTTEALNNLGSSCVVFPENSEYFYGVMPLGCEGDLNFCGTVLENDEDIKNEVEARLKDLSGLFCTV